MVYRTEIPLQGIKTPIHVQALISRHPRRSYSLSSQSDHQHRTACLSYSFFRRSASTDHLSDHCDLHKRVSLSTYLLAYYPRHGRHQPVRRIPRHAPITAGSRIVAIPSISSNRFPQCRRRWTSEPIQTEKETIERRGNEGTERGKRVSG